MAWSLVLVTWSGSNRDLTQRFPEIKVWRICGVLVSTTAVLRMAVLLSLTLRILFFE